VSVFRISRDKLNPSGWIGEFFQALRACPLQSARQVTAVPMMTRPRLARDARGKFAWPMDLLSQS